MAAEIKAGKHGAIRKPVLVNKIEGCTHAINMAVLVTKMDAVISVSDDKTVRVWQKRDSGQFWPSICHSMPSEASSVDYNAETGKLFIGLDNGTISEYIMEEDFNRMTHRRDYIAHQGRVMSVKFSLACEWVLSCSKDRYFQWHCSETGRRLGGFQATAWCLCMEFDEQSKYAFVGDYSGQISVLKIKDTTFEHITTLKGHTGSVWCLAWDIERKLLFSGSFDQSIIVWDIGGRQGTAFELQGHKDKVQGLAYLHASRQLISASDDCILGLWSMDVKRNETPEWAEGDTCSNCHAPFFWNWRKMWDEKTIGNRQHHCRKCGKVFCNKCSSKKSSIPPMGYEYDVRVCDQCHETITDEERAPLATFHDTRHSIVHISVDATRNLLLTTGKDRIMKIWDLTSVIH